MLSGRASRRGDVDAYLLWHTGWHAFPVAACFFLREWALDDGVLAAAG